VLFAAVEVGQLVEVAWVSLLAGIIVCSAFSFVVLFSGRSAEARRSGAVGTAAVYAGLAVVAMIAFLAVVGYGVHVMLSKG
jgi:hypothetical protein